MVDHACSRDGLIHYLKLATVGGQRARDPVSNRIGKSYLFSVTPSAMAPSASVVGAVLMMNQVVLLATVDITVARRILVRARTLLESREIEGGAR